MHLTAQRCRELPGAITRGVAACCSSWLDDRRVSREVREAFRDPAKGPILVYQMGKVGSSSVYGSLKTALRSSRVFHVHFLSDDIEAHINLCRRADLRSLPYHFRLGLALRAMLKARPEPRCRIISLVRDPIAVAVSCVFQVPQFSAECLGPDGRIDSAKTLRYLDGNLKEADFFNYVFTWFDRELNRVFGIDVFAGAFDRDRGYSIYRGARADALVIRMEDLSASGPGAIAGFLGLAAPLELMHKNVRSELKNGAVYGDVLDRLVLSRETCERVYSSRFARQFYTAPQLAAFTAKWSRPARGETDRVHRAEAGSRA